MRDRPCPVCKRPTPEDGARWRPFCSERCQLLDLGRWLDEAYVVPGERAETPTDDQSGGSGTS